MVGPNGRDVSDWLVFDLDPGPDATIIKCCVAERLQDSWLGRAHRGRQDQRFGKADSSTPLIMSLAVWHVR